MSSYEWPVAPGADAAREELDDSTGRGQFNARRHTGLGSESARLALRQPALRPARSAGSGALRAPANSDNLLWQPLGPATLLGGQAEGNPRVSGRINALGVHEGGLRAYAASANGGVWYTKNGGALWTSVAGLASTNTAGIVRPAQRNACGAIHVEWGALEGEDVVYLGTGEFTHQDDGQPGSSERGIGILVADKPAQAAANVDPWVREAPNLLGDGVFRIVAEPGGTTVIAATRNGLFQRPAAPGADVDWVRPRTAPAMALAKPFDTLTNPCTDALWTNAHGGRPARLWVWVRSGAQIGLWVRDAGAVDFVQVAIDGASPYGYTAGRGCLAAVADPTTVWLLNDRGSGNLPALFSVSNPVAATSPTATGVNGVPDILQGAGFYSIAIAADPSNPNRVALAGSWFGDPNKASDRANVTTLDGAKRGFDAGIVVAVVAPDPGNANQLKFGHPNPFTMIGMGAHSDVHALAYSNAGNSLWTGCDGGVFRTDAPLAIGGFYARNHGMSISESNFIANHPVCEGHLIAGLQDNGTVMRQSSGVWRLAFQGDGGGVVMEAHQPHRYMAQYVRGSWRRVPPGGTAPLTRGNKTSSAENTASAFYSTPASIAHVRTRAPAAPVTFSQTLIGTTRLWYTDNFGGRWVTLPTGTDPLPNNLTQDDLGEPILACRWQDPDTAWVLTPNNVYRYQRTPNSHNGGGAGTWTNPVLPLLQKNAINDAADSSTTKGPVRNAPSWTELVPNLLPGNIGAAYLGTVGDPTDATVDTLWWFDGVNTWFPTKLRTDANGVPAPVVSLLVEPAFPNEVWVGTTVGVWKGVRTRVGAADPSWAWTSHLNGLPEAAVEDLALFSHGGLRLLRAAIASRGVWELRLDIEAVPALTYLRAHDDDLRHRAASIAIQRDGRPRTWHGSPDVRPRVAPTAVAAPRSLPWRRDTFRGRAVDVEALRRFQAALRASVLASTGNDDPRIVANGQWDGCFSEVLRDHGAPTQAVPPRAPLPALARVRITKAFWETHMVAPHATAEPWGGQTPTEADLLEYTPALPEGSRARASCTLPAGACKIDVVVHHRGRAARDGADVRVTLLKWIDPKTRRRSPHTDSTRWFTGPVPWVAAVNAVLNSADGATPGALTDGWDFVGSTDVMRRLSPTGRTLEPMTAGIVTFDLDLSGVRRDTVVLLVAVIRAGADVALVPDTLENMVLNNPNVAVRSVRVRRA